MRSRSPANSAASSPPVPARTSSIAARSSAASRGSSLIASARSASGSWWRMSSASAAAISLSSGSAVGIVRPCRSAPRARRAAGALRAPRRRPARSPHNPWTGGRTRRARGRARAIACGKLMLAAPRSRRSVPTKSGSSRERLAPIRSSDTAALLAARQVLELRLAAIELVVADDQRVSRAPASSARLEPLLRCCRDSAMSAATPSRRKAGDDALRRRLAPRSPSGTITTSGVSGCRRVDHHRQPLDPGGPADRRRVRAAERFDQAVVAAAGDHRALRAEAVGDELERGVAVIIEAAHQPRVARPRRRRRRRARRSPRRRSPPPRRSGNRRSLGALGADRAGRCGSLLSRMRSGLRSSRATLSSRQVALGARGNTRPARRATRRASRDRRAC